MPPAARSRERAVRLLCVSAFLKLPAAGIVDPGGGRVPGRHIQVLQQERCVLSAPPPAASQIRIRKQGNLFIHYFRVFIWLSGLTWLPFGTTASGNGSLQVIRQG